MRRDYPYLRRTALAALCLLTALLVQLPASFLAEHLNRACAGHCRIARTDGAWWSGQGQLFLRSTGNSGKSDDWLDLGPLRWSIHWGYPLQLAIHIAGGDALLDGRWQSLTLSARQLTLPADWLLSQPALRLPNQDWPGKIALSALSLVIADASHWETHGQLEWIQAASRLLPELPPGTLHLQWQLAAPNGGEARLHSAAGDPLDIAATGHFASGSELARVEATFTATPSTPAAVTRQLAAIARPDPVQAGRYRFEHTFR